MNKKLLKELWKLIRYYDDWRDRNGGELNLRDFYYFLEEQILKEEKDENN